MKIEYTTNLTDVGITDPVTLDSGHDGGQFAGFTVYPIGAVTTPNIVVQGSPDGTTWKTLGTITSISGATSIAARARYLRFNLTVGTDVNLRFAVVY